MTSEAKRNYNNGGMLQAALKTGKAFGGGWRKQENKLSLCLGIVGKQQSPYSKLNILLFFHTKNTPPLLAAVLGLVTVSNDSLQNCKIEFFMLCWYTMWLFLKWQNGESQKLVSGSDCLSYKC